MRRQRESTWTQAAWRRLQLLLGYACLLPPPPGPPPFLLITIDLLWTRYLIRCPVKLQWVSEGCEEKGGGGAAVVNVEWQNQLALIGKRFILPKRTQSKRIKLPWPPDNFDTTQWLLFWLRYS